MCSFWYLSVQKIHLCQDQTELSNSDRFQLSHYKWGCKRQFFAAHGWAAESFGGTGDAAFKKNGYAVLPALTAWWKSRLIAKFQWLKYSWSWWCAKAEHQAALPSLWYLCARRSHGARRQRSQKGLNQHRGGRGWNPQLDGAELWVMLPVPSLCWGMGGKHQLDFFWAFR